MLLLIGTSQAVANSNQLTPDLVEEHQLSFNPIQSVQCDETTRFSADPRFSDALSTQNYFLAVDENYMYRRPQNGDWWSRLDCPDSLQLGRLESLSNRSDIIVTIPDHGMYVTVDAGLTWYLVGTPYSFETAYVSDDGKLFAAILTLTEDQEDNLAPDVIPTRIAASDVGSYSAHHRVVLSEDLGLTWEDITGNIPAGVRIAKIVQDHDDPSMVCLNAINIRPWAIRVSSVDYGQYEWKMIIFGDCRKPETLEEP